MEGDTRLSVGVCAWGRAACWRALPWVAGVAATVPSNQSLNDEGLLSLDDALVQGTCRSFGPSSLSGSQRDHRVMGQLFCLSGRMFQPEPTWVQAQSWRPSLICCCYVSRRGVGKCRLDKLGWPLSTLSLLDSGSINPQTNHITSLSRTRSNTADILLTAVRTGWGIVYKALDTIHKICPKYW